MAPVFQFLLLLFAILGFPGCESQTLTILHTNDIHAHYSPFDETVGSLCLDKSDAATCVGGIARQWTAVKSTVDALAAQGNGEFLLLDAGDQFQGTLFFNLFGSEISTYFMNLIKYDAMTLGNREFDNGPVFAATFMRGISNTKVVISNMDWRAEPTFRSLSNIAPYAVITKGGHQYGILGVVLDTLFESSSPGKNLFVTPALDALPAAIQQLKRETGVNKIILISHAGFDQDIIIAQKNPEIDVIVGGHSHTLLSNVLNTTEVRGPYPFVVSHSGGLKTLIVHAALWGRYMGNLQVTFDSAGHPTSWSGEPIYLNGTVGEDAIVDEFVAQFTAPIQVLLADIAGETTCPLNSSNCRFSECGLGNAVSDMFAWVGSDQQRIDIAFANGGALRAPLIGNVSVGAIQTALPFSNTVVIMNINGSIVRLILENSVSRLNSNGTTLGQSGTGRFLQVAGLRVTINPRYPVGSRVQEVLVQQDNTFVPLENEKIYSTVMSIFMAQGGDDNTFLIGRPYIDTGLTLAAQFESYLEEFSPLPCPVQSNSPRIILNFDEPTSPPSGAARSTTTLALLILSSLLCYFL